MYDDDNQLYIFQAIMQMITLYYITDLYLISSLCICFKNNNRYSIRIFTAWKTTNDEILNELWLKNVLPLEASTPKKNTGNSKKYRI